MTQYDLGQVVGADGQDGVDGSDGSTIWYTSTAPTYANSKYTFTISNLSGKTGFTIAVNDLIFYDTYYYIVSAVNSTTVDCATRVSIKGSDASVTIVDNLTSDSSTSVLSAKQGKVLNTNKVETSAIKSSFSATTSDSNIASEKLVKTELDKKIATSSTSGLVKNDGSIMVSGTGSSNWAVGNHTHSAYVNPTKVTSWSATVSDDNVASEKLIKDSLDDKVSKSSTTGLLKNDGSVDTNSYLTTSSASSTYQTKLVSGTSIKTINNESLLGSGNITIQGGSSVDIVTAWETTPSDSKVASEKLVKDTLDAKLDNALSSSTVSVETGDSILFTDYNDGNKIKKTDKILATQVKDSVAHSTIGTGVNATQYAINDAIDTALGNKVSKSSTTGLLKNDGSVDTNTYLTNSAITGMLTSSDIANNLTTSTTGKVLDASQGKALADLIGDAITYINQ